MKKQIVLFMCILLLAACGPQQQPPSQETTASAEAPAPPQQQISEEEKPAAASSTPTPAVPSSTPEVPETPEKPALPAPPIRVDAALTVSYGETPHFSQTLSVPADASYYGNADTVTVERQNGGVWETLREGTGSFTLEGKLTVNGPLPQRVLQDALSGDAVLYRVTTLLQTDGGGTVTASSAFRAGEAFADDARDKALANGDAFESVTAVDMSGGGLLPFTQTVTNNSGQTVSMGRHYKVLSQSGGGVWKEAAYPRGEEPFVTEDLLFLLPGQSAELSGVLPITAGEAEQGGNYRILRTASLISPREGQETEISFVTQLEAGSGFRESAYAESEGAVLRNVELKLGQTSFLAGEAPLGVYIENKSDTPIVIGRLRVYNVRDGENLLEEAGDPRPEIPAGGTHPALETALELEPGEYTVEAAIRVKDSGVEASLSKNFTVEADKLKNPASAATVEMKVEIGGQTEDGLATFQQTFVNNSCQTLLAGRQFRVEQQAGGLWAKAQYPAGSEPDFPQDMVLLRPGSSVTFEGVLPFPAKDMPGMYRITRTLMVENPTKAQTNGLTLVYTVTKK